MLVECQTALDLARLICALIQKGKVPLSVRAAANFMWCRCTKPVSRVKAGSIAPIFSACLANLLLSESLKQRDQPSSLRSEYLNRSVGLDGTQPSGSCTTDSNNDM
jgi:hypothetical protein